MSKRLFAAALVALTLAACVDHRPLRTEVFNENIYLPKSFLTRENPQRPGSKDNAWLFQVTLTKTSVPAPNMLYLTPGLYTDPRYVRFQFDTDKVEMVDDTEYAPQVMGPDGNMISSPSVATAMLNAWPGSHVDIQMKNNLDGERTNVIEENKERDWRERQWFKVDLAQAKVPDVNMIWWAMTDYYIGDCMHLRNVSLVPDSYELEQDAGKQGSEQGDDYVSWTIALTYELAVFGGGYYCGQLLPSPLEPMNRYTFTYHLKYALWRPPQNKEYKPLELEEKDPVRLKVGVLETVPQVFHDPKTFIPGAKKFTMRFDPHKTHTFYFAEGYPDEYKEHFRSEDATKQTVQKQINELMAASGVAMRVEFKEWNDGGKKRTPGDPRYNMLVYHDFPNFVGLGGLAILNPDPRTGELLSGGFNVYHWHRELAVSMVQDFLSEITDDAFDDDKSPLKTPCTPGETVPLSPAKIAEKHKNTSLYTKLEDYMKQPTEEWVPKHSEDFGKYMRMLIPDLRFASSNSYVWGHLTPTDASLKAMLEKDQLFQERMAALDRGKSPFGSGNLSDKSSIEQGIAHIKSMKDLAKNHLDLERVRRYQRSKRFFDMKQPWEFGPAVVRSSRACKADRTWETRDEWAKRVMDAWFQNTAVHEFGHTLGLSHNFLGSVDKDHFAVDKEGKPTSITSAIMEYAHTYAEGADPGFFLPWDLMSLKYIYGGVKPDEQENWLYCSNEHADFSPFCTTHDIGTTPTEIIKNEIELYEWGYKFRNFRAYRKFWNLFAYGSDVFYRLYPLRRFLNLWAIDWYSEDLKNDLNLLGVKGDEFFFKGITDEFNDEMGRANRLTANFYKAILQQSTAERTYATKFDNFYGDVTQQGIILDKYYAMFLFLGLWPIDDYDQNIYAYLAYHDYSLGNPLFYSDCQDAVDSMIGGQYDVYPWFKPLAVLLFAQDTTDVMFGDKSKKRWIQMRRFDRLPDMTDFFGMDPRTEALTVDNPYQTFTDKEGNKWIYYYLADRNQHIVANKNLNPTAFKILWDQNERMNVNKSGSTDDYEIKYYLDFYEYFN